MHKLLVVDDEKDVCDFSKTFFEGKQLQVFCVLSGEEALDIVRKEKPTVVLLDIKMKGMDGIEVLRQIKEIDNNIDVIMVTAMDEKQLMEDAVKLGASDYVTKPLVLEELERKVMARVSGD
jgi:DNA-binding response OmpR family regulator